MQFKVSRLFVTGLMAVAFLIALILCWVWMTCRASSNAEAAPAVQPIPPNVEFKEDLIYGKGGTRDLEFDYYKLKDTKGPLPVIVYIHGGGARSGGKEWGRTKLLYMVTRGYFCVSINFRSVYEGLFPAQIEDAKCAIRFLRAKAKELDIDPNHIGVWGASLGGHLAALLGTCAAVKEYEGSGGWQNQSSRVQAVVDYYGISDWVRWEQPRNIELYFGPDAINDKALLRKASPLFYIDKNTPPFFLAHGGKDGTVPLIQSQDFYTALKKAGIPADLNIIDSGGHETSEFEREDMLKMVGDFFDKYLKDKGATTH